MKFKACDLAGKKVLVTGGTGFIGGRLIEKLVIECQAHVRVLLRNYETAVRIGRFPIEMVLGNVIELEDVQRAVQDCDVVFHCAYGNTGDDQTRRLINVEGTRNVMLTALQAGTKRIVHLSTVDVYGGNTPDGELDETAPRVYSKDGYADSKLDAEKLVFKYRERDDLPVVIIQPTIVYGPFASTWTVNPLQQLKTGQIILPNGGEGFCNAVYIDDLINAILLAAIKDEAIGEAFLISGEQPITWRDYYGRYAQMLGISSGTVNMTIAEIRDHYNKHKRKEGMVKELVSIMQENPQLRGRLRRTSEGVILRSLLEKLPDQIQKSMLRLIKGNGREKEGSLEVDVAKPIHPLSPTMAQLYTVKTKINIEKAKRMLGYQPVYDFETGIGLTEQWARWANLL